MVQVAEPAKTDALTFEGPWTLPRCAFVTMYDAAAKLIYGPPSTSAHHVIDSWKSVPGRFPSYLVEHVTGVEERRPCRSALGRRQCGAWCDRLDLAMMDPWPAGLRQPQDHFDDSALICRQLTFIRAAQSEHGYARPIEGLIVTFDLDPIKVIDIEDHGAVPLPPTAGNFAEKFMFDKNNQPAGSTFHDDVKPIEITQPEGPASPLPARKCSGRSGLCESASIRTRASSCTR